MKNIVKNIVKNVSSCSPTNTHRLQLQSQLVVGELERPGDSLQVVNQHAETQEG